MQGLAVVVTLLAMGAGFAAHGLVGTLTGIVAAVGTGSGLAIAAAERGTGVTAAGPVRIGQRLGGLISAAGCLAGAFYGGWGLGWLWGGVGYAAGMVASLVPTVFLTIGRRSDPITLAEHQATSTEVPSSFDLSDPVHVVILDDIRSAYGQHLADDTNPYSSCMFQPASSLPYPKTDIRNAMTALLDFVEGRRESSLLDVGLRQPEVAETLKVALIRLDDFIDIPPADLPTDPMENIQVGFRIRDA